MNDDKISRCPHCGSISTTYMSAVDTSVAQTPHVVCLGCKASAPSVEAWNKRHTFDALPDPSKACEWFDGHHECGKPATFEWMLPSADMPLCDEHRGIVAKHLGESELRKITGNSVDGQPPAQAQDPRCGKA